MTSFTTDCPSCEKKFETLYSLKKHVRQRHEGIDEDSLIPCFKDQDGKELQPAHASSLRTDKAGYLTWLAGITERVNSTFHPRLPGKDFIPVYIFPILPAIIKHTWFNVTNPAST